MWTDKTVTEMATCSRVLTHRLWQLPARANVNDCLNNAVTVIVDEGQRTTLIWYRQCELIVINKTHLKNQGNIDTQQIS